nr:DUF11 domain-containing protein [Phyllobacterium phragmitis]
MTNVVQADGTAVPSTTLTTTAEGTPVSSPAYNAVPGTDLTLSEIVPTGWNLASAVCTDQNAGATGNPTVIGSLASPTLTIPGANVRPQSDIQCLFTNANSTDLAITKDDGAIAYAAGGNVTYSIVVSNNGPSAVTGARVSDPLPAGITTANWTCGGVTGGAACGAASGAGAIDTTADLPVGASVTYALTMGVPADFTGDLVNTANVETPDGITDTDTSNNTASDTDVPGVPGLTIDKTGTLNDLDGDGLLDLGETISYAFLVTNTGNLTLTDVTVDDPKVTVDEAAQTLAPGGTFTFHGTYTPTQPEIDAGQVSNTATGTGTTPDGGTTDSPPDTVLVPPDQTPGLTIEKTGTLNDLDGDGLLDLGETISYTFLVTNTGTVTLSDVTVDDPKVTVDEAPQTLSPRGSFTFHGTYTPTQSEIDAGEVSNTATGTGTTPDGGTTDSPPDTVVVPPDQASGLTVDKTGTLNDLDGDGLLDPGETITYAFLVTNTGAVTLSDVTVKDPLLANAGISVTPGPQTLTPGASFTFTATYTPTQDEIDAGSVSNTATGTGTTPDGGTTDSPPDTAVVPPDQTPGLTIDKSGTLNDLDGDGLLDPGETITYSFLVTNTGNVTLTGVTVDDPKVTVNEDPQTLGPRGSFTFHGTYTPTQDEIDAGQVSNTATGTGTPPGGGDPIDSPPDTVVVPPDQTPGLTIDKTGTLNDLDGDGLLDLGETISYTFLVTNTGNVTLTGVTVDDPKVTVNEDPQTLGPRGSFTFHGTYTPTQDEIDAGQVSNTATGTGTPPGGGDPIDSPPDTVVVPPDQASGLTIDKTGTLNDLDGDGLLDPGETVSYAFLVTNTGAVTLSGVTVNDPLLANAGIELDQGPQTLAPGRSFTFTATYTPTQGQIDAGSVTNTATGTGTTPDGGTTDSPPDTVVVPPDQASGLIIEKSGMLDDRDGDNLIDPGESIIYSFVVTNTGAVTLSDVTVNDPLLADAGISVTPGPQRLTPGRSVTFTATYTPTQAHIDAGRVENTATPTGTPPSGPPIEGPPDTIIVPPEQTSDMTIDKQGTLDDLNGNALIDPGESIAYAFVVTNTGAVTLSGVTVDDPLLANAGVALDQGPQVLAPGASFTFTARYTPTQGQIEAGSVSNTATGVGTPPSGPPVQSPPDTAVVPPVELSRLTIEKTGRFNDVDGNGYASLGDTITYSFIVTNTGEQVITDVAPVDAGPTFNGKPATATLSAFTPPSVTLGARAAQTFTAIYTLTQEDIDNAAGVTGGMENSATVKGNAGGTPVPSNSSTSTVTIPPAEPSDISIVKQAGLRQIKRGEKAPFTIKVTNHSSRNAGSVVVTDIIPSGFRFIDGSATVDGVAATPVIAGQRVRFDDVALGPNAEVIIRLQMLALSSAGPGKHTNKAVVNGPDGAPLAPEARADIEIMIEPVFDCGDIIGKVFDDTNRNGYQDEGELGLPGVRVATVRGSLVTTDRHGRFHVACADLPDSRIGSNFIMKLDPRTLPAGYRLTTENPRVIRLTAGKMSTLNFGASIGRVVRLDLMDAAFEAGTTTLKRQWQKGIDQLIAALEGEPSTLRIGYGATADAALARRRIQAIAEDIAQRWKSVRGRYELNIETRVEAGQ